MLHSSIITTLSQPSQNQWKCLPSSVWRISYNFVETPTHFKWYQCLHVSHIRAFSQLLTLCRQLLHCSFSVFSSAATSETDDFFTSCHFTCKSPDLHHVFILKYNVVKRLVGAATYNYRPALFARWASHRYMRLNRKPRVSGPRLTIQLNVHNVIKYIYIYIYKYIYSAIYTAMSSNRILNNKL